ncbi:MAG: hypothetical protein OXG95_09400 [Chloroflexi bacterium]|nr:hypothetical protein [Chloroflexota bacterium]
MTRTKKTVAIAVGGLAALLLLGSVLAHPRGAFVDRSDVLARALGITAEEVEQAREDGTLKDLLADVTRDDLRTAYEAEATEVIDDASEAGDITSTQADRLKEVVSADRGDLTDDDIATLKSLRGAVTVDRTAVYASLLGITSDEVEAAKDDGTLREKLADVNRVALVAALIDARDAAIDAAEDAGDITAAQAELLREAGKGFGRFSGKGHGHWGKRGFGSGCGDSGEWSGDKKDASPVGDPA